MKKQTKMKLNVNALGKSVLFVTPLIGDIPLHRYCSKRRTINLEQRAELEKERNLGGFFLIAI